MNNDEIIEEIKQNYEPAMIPLMDYSCNIFRGTKKLSVGELRKTIDELKRYANETNVPIITACASSNGCNDIGKMQLVNSRLELKLEWERI